MSTAHNDALGKPLAVDDFVAASSGYRQGLIIGQIKKFTAKMVHVVPINSLRGLPIKRYGADVVLVSREDVFVHRLQTMK